MTTPTTLSITSVNQSKSSKDAIEELNIYAYLTPDPYNEDGYFEEEWVENLPGYKKGCDDYSLFDDHNVQLFESLTNEVEKEFKKGVEYLWPLMQHLDFKCIQISVDFLGDLFNDTSSASYFHGRSDAKAGEYVFFTSRSLAYKYLKSLEDGTTYSKYVENIWRHELIHLLDDSNIQKATLLLNTESIDLILEHYLISYRIEGVAEVILLLLAQNEFKSIEEAKEAFCRELEVLQPIISNYQTEPTEKIADKFRSRSSFYDIGPWFIMDLLLNSGRLEVVELTKRCLTSLQTNNPIEHMDILKMVKYALEISNEDFLKYLQSEGFTVKSILDQDSNHPNQ